LASGAGRSAAAGAIVVGMASPAETTTVDLPPLPKPGASPGEIRAALWPDYRAAFERDYRAALVEAGQELDLAPVHAVLEHWRMRAWMTRDRATHRRSMRRAVELLTGQQPPEDEPIEVTEARL
jgi:Family of unknown function (DUF6247)